VYLYDLDGTISTLNSTFDFIYPYFLFKKKYVKYYSAKIFKKVVDNIPGIPYRLKRKAIILMLFYRVDVASLEFFFEVEYKEAFLQSLTGLGTQVAKQDNQDNILLTGCTEIPAKCIGHLLNFKNIISTEFRIVNGRIKGISQDTYGNYKSQFLDKGPDDYFVYFTDDLKTERKLIPVMDEIVEVEPI
jgi:hypothetical protein